MTWQSQHPSYSVCLIAQRKQHVGLPRARSATSLLCTCNAFSKRAMLQGVHTEIAAVPHPIAANAKITVTNSFGLL